MFGAKSTAKEVISGHDLKGCEVIVTGGSSGIGIETVRAFAFAGARVILAARDLVKAKEVADEIINDTKNKHVEVEKLDISSLKSVNEFVQRFLEKNRPLNILVNNAGIMACPLSYTEDGFESQFGTNHLGHFALAFGLIPALKKGAKLSGKNSRVISVTSIAHYLADFDFDDFNYKTKNYNEWEAYGQSKTANVLFAVELTRRYLADGVVANAVMPGGILTGLQKHLTREDMIKRGWIDENGNINPRFKTLEQGASTSVWAAVAPELENKGGLYLEDCAISPQRTREELATTMNGFLPHAIDAKNAERLWNLSEELIKK